jgi:hypothetical protein
LQRIYGKSFAREHGFENRRLAHTVCEAHLAQAIGEAGDLHAKPSNQISDPYNDEAL